MDREVRPVAATAYSMKSPVLASFVIVLLVACKEEPPPYAPPPAIAKPPGSTKPTAAPATDDQPKANFEPSAPIPARAENQLPSRDEIYEATRKFGMDFKRPASGIEELVSRGYIKPIPPPPPGKKYVLNQRGASLMVVDK